MGLRETLTLKETLEAAIEYRTGPTKFAADEEGMAALRRRDRVLRVADAHLKALAPELASLVLDMGEWMRNAIPNQGFGADATHGRRTELLARLDQLGKEQTDG